MNKMDEHTKQICDEFVDDMKIKDEMKSHNEFMEDVEHAKSLPAQTCRALGPESEEDISMYANCEGGENE